MKKISNYSFNNSEFGRFENIIRANAPVSYGGNKLFDGDRDYLMQIPEEFSATLCFFKEVFSDKPINFLEIGTASNLTNTMFWNNFNIKNNIIVDNLECPNVDRCLIGNLSFKDGTVFVVGDSTGDKVQKIVKSLNLKYGIIFCDGNHEYDYVRKDFDYYSKFVKSGGYFVFHDTDNWRVPGVKQFVDELDDTIAVGLQLTKFIKVAEFKEQKYENTCGISIYRNGGSS